MQKPPAMEKPLAVLWAFLKLGLMSFGGPLAHIGFFREEFVVRRRWLSDGEFSDLVSLCQFLPGPASSQLGFSIGLARAGFLGGAAAWTGFTLPSTIAMVAVAYGATTALRAVPGLLHGLNLAAVAIVAQAVTGMARSLCPDLKRACIAVAAALVTLVYTGSRATMFAQVGVLVGGGVAGFWMCRTSEAASRAPIAHVSRRVGAVALVTYALLLIGLPLGTRWPAIALFGAFYHAGALVFGGGHVVLPLLREAFVTAGWVPDELFLAGYGAAQAVPGPLFTFAAYLGAVTVPAAHRLAGAALGVIGIFLPGILILVGVLPFWQQVRSSAAAQGAMRGINAAVVGLLGAALYNPIGSHSVETLLDLTVALVGWVLLMCAIPPLAVVAAGALCGVLLAPRIT